MQSLQKFICPVCGGKELEPLITTCVVHTHSDGSITELISPKGGTLYDGKTGRPFVPEILPR